MLEPEELAELANLRHHPPEAAAADPAAFLHAAVDEITGLRIALAPARTTGQATGIVMERFGLDAETAFATLRQLSQDTNRKLYDLADDLTHEQRAPSAVPDRSSERTLGANTGPHSDTQQTG